VLEQDKQEPKKQRHTAKRIFDRLKVERGYGFGYASVLVCLCRRLLGLRLCSLTGDPGGFLGHIQ
jgi:hypothetical protein